MSRGAPATTFSVDTSTLFRLVDVNDDGDYNDVDEANLFAQPSGTGPGDFWALARNKVLWMDNSAATKTILWLEDLNADGDALDPQEVHTWFSGTLPGGGAIGNLRDMQRDAQGAVFVEADPQAFYRMHDDNNDGDVDDAGEITTLAQVDGLPVRSFTADSAGAIWFLEDGSGDVYRVDGGVPTLVLSHSILSSTKHLELFGDLQTMPNGAIVSPAIRSIPGVEYARVIVSIADHNGDQTITEEDVTEIWNEIDGDFPCPFDSLRALEDGSLIAHRASQEDDTVFRFVDGNSDGDFLDVGETYVAHDRYFAAMHSQMDVGLEKRISASTAP